MTTADRAEVGRLTRLIGADTLLLLLAIASAVIVIVVAFHWASPAAEGILLLVDLGIVLVFLNDFLWRLARAPAKRAYLLRSWFTVFGLIPLILLNFVEQLPQADALRAWHVFGVVGLAGVLARFARVYNAIVGDHAARLLFDKLRAAALEEISDRVALRILQQLEQSVASATYAKAIGVSLEARKTEVAQAILDAMGKTPGLRPVAGFGPAATAVEHLSDNVTTMLAETLKTPQVNALVSDSIRGVLASLQAEILRKEWRELPLRAPQVAPASPD